MENSITELVQVDHSEMYKLLENINWSYSETSRCLFSLRCVLTFGRNVRDVSQTKSDFTHDSLQSITNNYKEQQKKKKNVYDYY